MAYTKTNWKDLICSLPSRFKMKNTSTGAVEKIYDLERDCGEVTQDGTTINADKLNNMETGIYNNDAEITKIKNGTTKPAQSTKADKLTTARTIAISGGATGTATSFDGSENITIPITALASSKLSGAVAVANGGTGATTASSARGNLGVPPTNHASSATTFGLASSSVYGHVKTYQGIDYSGTDTFALHANQGKVLNDNIKASQLASYMAFVAKLTDTTLDCAFGKNNETMVGSIGRQMAMYSWFLGDSKTTYPFTSTVTKNTLDNILSDANSTEEVAGNANTVDLMEASPYAKAKSIKKIPFPPPASTGLTSATVIASNFNNINATSYKALSYNEPLQLATITVPYSGKYRVDSRFYYSGNATYEITIKANDVVIYSQSKTPDSRESRHYTSLHLKKNDVVKTFITRKSETVWSRIYGVYGTMLIADRPLTCTSASAIGNNVIWSIPYTYMVSSVHYTNKFTAPYSGTFRILYSGHAYSENNSTYFAIYKNDALAYTPPSEMGGYYDIALNAGDTVCGYTKGNSNVTGGESFFSVFAICKATNQNTYPY